MSTKLFKNVYVDRTDERWIHLMTDDVDAPHKNIASINPLKETVFFDVRAKNDEKVLEILKEETAKMKK